MSKIRKSLLISMALWYFLLSLSLLPGSYAEKEYFIKTFNQIPLILLVFALLTVVGITDNIHKKNLVYIITDGESKDSIKKSVKSLCQILVPLGALILAVISCIYTFNHEILDISGSHSATITHSISMQIIGLQIFKILVLMVILTRLTFSWTLRNIIKPLSSSLVSWSGFICYFIIVGLRDFIFINTLYTNVFYGITIIVLVIVDLLSYKANIEFYNKTDVA